MKSRLLAAGVGEPFFDHVKLLSSLPVGALEEFLKTVAALDPDVDSPVNMEAVLPIASKYSVSMDDLSSCLSVAYAIIRKAKQDDESPVEAVLDDLVELGKIPDESVPDLRAKLSLAEEIAYDKMRRLTLQKTLVESTLPSLSHFHTRCCILPRLHPGFDRAKDTPESYNPAVEFAMPVVMVQIDIDRFGHKERSSFGLTGRELREIVNHLQLALKELEAVRAHYRFSS